MKKLAFTIALIGILVILIINNLDLTETPIEKISKDDLNKIVKVSGISSDIKIYENNFTTFNLKSQGEITVICNCPDIQEKQKLTIIGRVSQYKNTLQIQADNIEKN